MDVSNWAPGLEAVLEICKFVKEFGIEGIKIETVGFEAALGVMKGVREMLGVKRVEIRMNEMLDFGQYYWLKAVEEKVVGKRVKIVYFKGI